MKSIYFQCISKLKFWQFLSGIAIVSGLLITFFHDRPLGDWEEYFLTEQALLSHASPEIRYSDFSELKVV